MHKVSLETLTLLIGIAAIALLISVYDLNGTLRDFAHLRPDYLLFAVGAFFAYTAWKFFPWSYIIRKLKLRISITQSFVMMYAFYGMGIVPSSVGQFLPLKYLSNFKKNASFFSLGIILALGATSGLALLLMTIISAIFLSKYITYLVALFAITYLYTSLLGMERTQNILIKMVNKIFNPKKHPIFKNLASNLKGLGKHHAFLSQKDIIIETVLFLPSLFFEAILLLFVLLALNQSVPIVSVVFIFGISVAVGNLFGGISLLPAGLGITDTAMVALLLLFGIPGAVAITVTILFRFFNTFCVFLAAYLSMFYMKMKFPKLQVKVGR
jgi:uncharacterized protein (TIRG00374 family)